jgi:uncharacterized protein
MDEYRTVLGRPEFGSAPSLVADLLTLIGRSEWILPDPLPLEVDDPDDRAFLEVAVAGGADALVTGNVQDFGLRGGTLDLPVLTPRQYLDLLAGRATR